MIILRNLTIRELKKNRTLIKDLSCVINDNEKVAIIGQEGVGKSTLLRAINKESDNYFEVQGTVEVVGSLSYLKQKLDSKYEKYSIHDYLIDGDYDNYQYLSEAMLLLSKFGILDIDDERPLDTYSGGELVKIMLSKVLMSNPSNILMDEPSNNLDLETILFLEDFINTSKACILFVSHDVTLLKNTTDGVIHLSLVKKRSEAQSSYHNLNYEVFHDEYLRKYERESSLAKKERDEMNKKKERFRRIYQKVEHQQNQAVRDPSLGRKLKVKIHAMKSQERRFEKEEAGFHEFPVIEEPINIFFKDQKINPQKIITKISHEDLYNGSLLLINDIDLEVHGSDRIALLGRNGSGKTTLLKRIILDLEARNIKYGYISQDYQQLLDNTQFVVPFLASVQNEYKPQEIRKILGGLGFNAQEMENVIGSLSEGQKLKLILFLLICGQNEVLILDEPTRNLSPINQNEIINLFNSFNGAIICVSHDRSFIENVCDKLYLIENKELKNIV